MINSVKKFSLFLKANLELIFWILSLFYLALIGLDYNHFSFCPLNQLGYDWCPGCGLGRSITLIFHLKFYESLIVHPIGIFALVIIVLRIIQLLNQIGRKQYG